MDTLSLTPLEKSVIAEIGRQHPECQETLECQLSTAEVIRRENTGVGFFTDLSVKRTCPALAEGETVLGNVWVRIENFQNPMTFLIFVDDGYVKVLEGAAVGDSTFGIDLSRLEFKIEA